MLHDCLYCQRLLAFVLEMGKASELGAALAHGRRVERLEPPDAEVLAGERGDRAAVDDRATQGRLLEVAGPGQVADERAGEAVAGAGRILDRLERVARRD